MKKYLKKGRNWEKTILAELGDMLLKGNLPTTERHLMYRLEAKGFLSKKSKADLNYLSAKVTLLRERGLIPNDWIVDFSREIIGEDDFDCGDPEDFLLLLLQERIMNSYKHYVTSHWEKQVFFPIFVVEKEAMTPIFVQVLKDYRVKIVPSRGNPSYPQMKNLISLMPDNQTTRIFLFSDCDYAGYDAERDLKERISRYAPNKSFMVERIALTEQQVLVDYKLPYVTPNSKDTRSKQYPLKVASELDTIETSDMKTLIINAIESCITDRTEWNNAMAREQTGKQELQTFPNRTRIKIDGKQVYP